MTRTRRRGAYGLLLANVAAAVAVFVFHGTPVIANLENAFVDFRYWLRGVVPPESSVVVVAIDNASLRELGLFPWRRSIHARLLDRLTRAGARCVAFDAFFEEPDPRYPDDDCRFADAAAASDRTVLAILFNRDSRGQPADPVLPMPSLQREPIGMGFVNIFPEKDGATRRAPLWVRHNGVLVPSLGVAAWSRSTGVPPETAEDRRWFPVDTHSPWNEAYINYTYWREGESTRSPFSYRSYADVLNGRVPDEEFRGKIVLVGATAPGLYDAKSAPGAPVIYGIEIHANVVNNLLRRSFFRVTATTRTPLFGILLLFAGAGWLLMSRSSTFVGAGTAVFLLVAYFYLGQMAFDRKILLPYAAPVVGFVLTYLMGLGYRLLVADRERESIKNTWSRYMSPKLVDMLVEGSAVPTAGHREVTVFFSDLAQFTTLSEQFPPGELVNLLNAYFSLMTDILFKYDITFDKYIGDSIMGYGNAPLEQPDHAAQACRAALAQVAALPGLHRSFAEKGWPALRFRIGIHTGVALYGDLGSYTRSNYTVMGDTVNLASRLEGVNKLFGTQILISETTYQAARDIVDVRELDLLRVEGKKQPIRVYELTALKNDLSPSQRHGYSIFADALRLYRERRFAEARAEFLRVGEMLPGDRPSAVYDERCQRFLQAPPPADWDGVYVMTSK